MNLNINIIIKSFIAISFTFLVVIGLIRIGNNLFYVESINPPSKDELFANIDFIDETYFSEKSKPNNEINIVISDTIYYMRECIEPSVSR